MICGRGAGKTRAAAERLRERILSGKAKRISLIGATFADVRDTMVEGESGLEAVCGDLFETYNRSIGEIRFKGGAQAKFFSGEEPDRLRGPQSTDVWGDELASWTRAEETFDMAMFGLRLGEPEAIWTTTPRAIKVIKGLIANKSCKVTRGSTYANRDNLAPEFFEAVIKKYEGTTLGRQEIEGEILDDVQGALWKREWFETEGFRYEPATGIEDGRLVFYPPEGLQKVVVAIDPSVTDPERRKNKTKDPDTCGLVVAGSDEIGHGHVFGDYTKIMSPGEWAAKAVKLYDFFSASCIVAEANQGGELIREVIRSISSNVNVVLVHASMAKRPRAEPLAMLYEQGRFHHHGTFLDLEDQLTTWDATDPSAKSPGNLDALTWAGHGLGLCVATGTRVYDRVLSR